MSAVKEEIQVGLWELSLLYSVSIPVVVIGVSVMPVNSLNAAGFNSSKDPSSLIGVRHF